MLGSGYMTTSVYLNVADAGYMDKLICDGHITIDK